MIRTVMAISRSYQNIHISYENDKMTYGSQLLLLHDSLINLTIEFTEGYLLPL